MTQRFLVGEVSNGLRKRITQRVLNVDDALAALEAIAELELDLIGGSERWFRTVRASVDSQSAVGQ